jgi:RES domain-containing protein
VIYLGRPPDSVTVEAHRHLVEAQGVPAQAVRPRTLYTVDVAAHDILDLTDPEHLAAVGLAPADLATAVDDYDACQEVARAAHQLERHGVLAPAATGLGQSLALFTQRLTAHERPVVVAETLWPKLPADPRVARAVRDGSDGD